MRDKLPEAENLLREALGSFTNAHGREHTFVAATLKRLSAVLGAQGQLPEAEILGREALTLGEKLLGKEDENVATARRNLAQVLEQRGKFSEAEPLLRENLAFEEKSQPGRTSVFVAQNALAKVLLAQKKYDEAETLWLKSYDGLERREKENSTASRADLLRKTVESLVELYESWGRSDEAARWREKLQ